MAGLLFPNSVNNVQAFLDDSFMVLEHVGDLVFRACLPQAGESSQFFD